MRSKTQKPAVGARPGTLVIDPQAPKPLLCVISYDEDTVEEHDSVGVADLVTLTDAVIINLTENPTMPCEDLQILISTGINVDPDSTEPGVNCTE